MHSDDVSKFYVDFEGLGRLCSGCHCAIQGARTVRADGARSAGWFGDGVAVVALSPAKKWGWLQPVAGKLFVVPPIGPSIAFQSRDMCCWECSRFDDRIEPLDC